MYLHQRVLAQGGATQGRCCTEKTRVRYFLDSLADTEYECGVHEGHYDVCIIFLCNQNYKAHPQYVGKCVVELNI